MCDLFIISGGFSWERSDLFLPPKWNVALAMTGLGRYLFFFEQLQKTHRSSGLTASQISRLAWPGASGVLRRVVFMEPVALCSTMQPGPGSAERGPAYCPLYLWSGRGDQHASHQTIPLVHSLRATGSFRAASVGDITCLEKSCKAKGLIRPAFRASLFPPRGDLER